MAVQIFGTRKCQDTKKAERFFHERGVPFHSVDLAEKGIKNPQQIMRPPGGVA